MCHQNFSYDYHSQYFEVSHESHKSNLKIIWDDYIETLTLSNLEYAMRRVMATQIMQNKEFINQNFNTKENLKKLDTLVNSLVIGSKALETKICLLAQVPLGHSLEEHIIRVATSSGKLIENPKERNNEVKEILDEKRIETLNIFGNNLPLSKVSHKNRKPRDHKTNENRELLAFRTRKEKFELKRLIPIILPEPPCRMGKRKGEGYERWLDKCPWKPNTIESSIEELSSKGPP